MNGAMVEVSGKKEHSGLGGFAWEQGPDLCSFDRQRQMTDSELLRLMSEFLDA